MRALLRAQLHPKERFDKLWDLNLDHSRVPSLDDYEQGVREIFRRMQYNVIVICQEDIDAILDEVEQEEKTDLDNPSSQPRAKLPSGQNVSVSPDCFLDANVRQIVKDLIRETPRALRRFEYRRVIMLAYGRDQAYFLVSAVNIDELHIRIKGGLFGSTERTCKDLIRKVSHDRKQVHPTLLRTLFLALGRHRNQLGSGYLTLTHNIEVIEPGERNATIFGEIIESPLRDLIKKNRSEYRLALLFFFSSFLLLIFTPTLAIWLEPLAVWVQSILEYFFNPDVIPEYTSLYIQGTLERLYSALFVTSIVTAANLIYKFLDIRRTRPINWRLDIDETSL